jgi:hypothetical protein
MVTEAQATLLEHKAFLLLNMQVLKEVQAAQ